VNLATCLVLPVRTDARPVGALALYTEQPGVFVGAAHDVPLLLAAQTGIAVHNASAYADARSSSDTCSRRSSAAGSNR
jgi:GAF domain-containing protein